MFSLSRVVPKNLAMDALAFVAASDRRKTSSEVTVAYSEMLREYFAKVRNRVEGVTLKSPMVDKLIDERWGAANGERLRCQALALATRKKTWSWSPRLDRPSSIESNLRLSDVTTSDATLSKVRSTCDNLGCLSEEGQIHVLWCVKMTTKIFVSTVWLCDGCQWEMVRVHWTR